MMEPAREMGAKDMGVEATPPVAPEEARVPATRDADALVSALIAVVGAGLVVAGSLLRWISLHNQALPLAGRSPLDITAAGTALTEGRVAAAAGAAGLVAAVVMFASLRPAVRRILGGVALAAGLVGAGFAFGAIGGRDHLTTEAIQGVIRHRLGHTLPASVIERVQAALAGLGVRAVFGPGVYLAAGGGLIAAIGGGSAVATRSARPAGAVVTDPLVEGPSVATEPDPGPESGSGAAPGPPSGLPHDQP
jgi:hypothetical protein